MKSPTPSAIVKVLMDALKMITFHMFSPHGQLSVKDTFYTHTHTHTPTTTVIGYHKNNTC